VVDKDADGDLALAAELFDSESGRHMTVRTTEPGVQCYTMNWGSKNADDHPHVQHNAICFEAQHYPNSINTPAFPTTVIKPGDVYTQKTVHNFTIRE
jgi:aldose 1-epimerase